MPTYFPFNKINTERLSCCFTWDDNSFGHSEIHLIFKDFGLNTTFYIVPGEPEFALKYAEQYSRLSLAGLDIGIHTLTHPQMTTVSFGEAQS